MNDTRHAIPAPQQPHTAPNAASRVVPDPETDTGALRAETLVMAREFVITTSGGAGSWAAGRRIIDLHGTSNAVLLFTDVKAAADGRHAPDDIRFTGEDDDTYRFLRDAARDLDVPLMWLQDGRNIWDVFEEEGWLGNSSLAHCSWELKTRPAREWLDANRDLADTVVVVGLDWTEKHRHARVYSAYTHTIDGCTGVCRGLFDEDGRLQGPGCKNLMWERGWTVEMPMNDKPLLAKPQMIDWLKRRGIKPPRLYALGFAHANCITCVKGGQAHWLRVMETFPEHYAYAERREQEFRASKPSRANTAILKDRRGGGQARPMTLVELRERRENEKSWTPDLFDWGGCGCFTDIGNAAWTPGARARPDVAVNPKTR